jgi:hypothetical protein
MGPGATLRSHHQRNPGIPEPGFLLFCQPGYTVLMARALRYRLNIDVQDRDLVVSVPSARFTAVYYKAAGQPQLILRQRSKCDNYELIAAAWQAANAKARELSWIV